MTSLIVTFIVLWGLCALAVVGWYRRHRWPNEFPGGSPSVSTREELPPAPRRATPLPPLDTAGNQGDLEAAPHRGRLIVWGGSIWRSR